MLTNDYNLKNVETFPDISNSFVTQSEKEQKSMFYVLHVTTYLSNVMNLFSNLHM